MTPRVNKGEGMTMEQRAKEIIESRPPDGSDIYDYLVIEFTKLLTKVAVEARKNAIIECGQLVAYYPCEREHRKEGRKCCSALHNVCMQILALATPSKEKETT